VLGIIVSERVWKEYASIYLAWTSPPSGRSELVVTRRIPPDTLGDGCFNRDTLLPWL